MLKNLFRFQDILSVLCCVLIFTVFAFGQNRNLQNELQNSFKAFDLIKLNNQKTFQNVKAGNSLLISTAERNFELALTPRDLRAAQYRTEDTTEQGVRPLERGEITTFKGKVLGENDSEVRLTIDGKKTEGYFDINGEKFFIEPAKNYSSLATDQDFVIYRSNDALNSEGFTCQSELAEKIENGKTLVAERGVQSIRTLLVLEIATEADFEFVTELGGANQANAEILNILNMVEGVYETELNLTISVVFQSTWSTPDPFTGTNTSTLLASFRNYWNINRPASLFPRDIAHLFTSKQYALLRGVSYLSVTCRIPEFSYGISGRVTFEPAKFLLTAHEIGHNLGANHAEAAQNCGDTIMNLTITALTPFTFCPFSRTEIGNYIAANNSCLSQQNIAATKFDFDNDRRADIAVFRPSNGVWYIANSRNNSFNSVQFGLAGDKPVSADFDGDNKTDVAVYRNGIWYCLTSSNNTFTSVGFGLADDIPTPADFDGDGKADVAVFRPSNGVWYRLNSRNGSFFAVQFGLNEDIPVAADYDGDGIADINVFRPSNGVWYRLNSGNGSFFAAQFGLNGDKPIAGDFDGDGRADLVVWRPSNGVWYLINSATGGFSAVGFGLSTDIPTAADYDGDGKSDISVFRPSNGVWYRLNSANNSFVGVQFGLDEDVPISSK